MSWLRFTFLILILGCSAQKPEPESRLPAIDSAQFAIVESELTPAILVHSTSKYLGLFADTNAPAYIAFATRNGPRPFKNGQKLNAAELEECWLLVWWTNNPPWITYLQRKPLALSLDTDGLHLSFANGAGDVVLLPLHGSATNIDTRKWPEFLLREPLMRIRYWAGIAREFPIACESSLSITNQFMTLRQKFQYHSIRDDWNTKPLKLAPISPPLALIADEKLKRNLKDLEMPTPHGPYMGIEGLAQWQASFPLSPGLPTNDIAASALGTIDTGSWPRLPIIGSIKPTRDQSPPPSRIIPLSRNARLITYPP